MKVKMITASNVYGLAKKINSYLKKIEDESVVDIKYCSHEEAMYREEKCSAMIILKD